LTAGSGVPALPHRRRAQVGKGGLGRRFIRTQADWKQENEPGFPGFSRMFRRKWLISRISRW
jgi:hypothetical protein